jgi:rubrerythrin
LRSLFRYLAEQEKVHKEKFLKLKDAVKNPSRSDSSPVWEEINLFIKAMTDSHLFSGVGKNINLSVRSSDEKSAVDYAIGFEKDTLLFFYQMVDLVRPVDQPMVKTVINEEKEHIRKLVAIREELT